MSASDDVAVLKGSHAVSAVVLGGLPAPEYLSISPVEGTEDGGTSVTITGRGFLAGATVKFDGVAATGVVVVSSTSITCVTPAGTAGTADVLITTSGGADTGTAAFEYTSSGFDPATLPLTMWYRDFAGAPWTPTASAGTSAANGNLTDDVSNDPPALGTPVDGHAPASFNGSSEYLTNSNGMQTFVNASAGTLIGMVYDAAPVADPGNSAPYSTAWIMGEYTGGGSTMGFGMSDAGCRFGYFYTPGSDWDSRAVAAAASAWHVVMARYNGTTAEIRVDDGAWTTFSIAAWDDLSSSFQTNVGANYDASVKFTGPIMELMAADTRLSDTDCDNLYDGYFTQRYPSAGLP